MKLSPALFFLFALLFLLTPLSWSCLDNQAPPARPIFISPQAMETSELPGGRRIPDSHTEDWLRRHGLQAQINGNDCAVCHIEADCVSCHVDPLAIADTVHPPNFALLHAIDARQGLMDCTSCHRPDTFCQACHVETRVSPRLDDRPPAAVAFHPPGWTDSAAPNNHGIMARRDIHECASCHTEQDCVSCHVGINPHPPEFRFQCRTWLETNPAPCTQCHTDVSALRSLCF